MAYQSTREGASFFQSDVHEGRARISNAQTAYVQADDASGVPSAEVIRNQLGKYFIDLRSALRLSHHDVARHLQTSPAVISALEHGVVEALPSWPETVRLIRAYTNLAGLDAGPCLTLLAGLLKAPAVPMPSGQHQWPGDTSHAGDGAVGSRPFSARPFGPKTNATGHGHQFPYASTNQVSNQGVSAHQRTASSHRRQAPLIRAARLLPKRTIRSVRRRPRRALYALGLPAAILLMALSPATRTSLIGPLQSVVIAFGDQVRVVLAPVHDGHRWIETSDPRARRGDKLQITRR